MSVNLFQSITKAIIKCIFKIKIVHDERKKIMSYLERWLLGGEHSSLELLEWFLV